MRCNSIRSLEFNLPTSDISKGSRPEHFHVHHHDFFCKLLLVKQAVETGLDIFDCMMPMCCL